MTAYRETTTDPGSKSAAEIEREVKAERAHVEETLDAIQERLSPGQLVDQTVTYLRSSGGGDFFRNLGDTVRNHPAPVVLVGVGLAWMMVAASRGNSHRNSARWADEDLDEYEADYYARTGYTAGDPYGASASVGSGLEDEASSSWSERAKATAESAKEKAEEWRQQARDAAGSGQSTVGAMRARARHTAEDARASAGEMGARARERMERARHELAERAGQTGYYARRYGRRARQGFLQTLDEQPLVLGAIGLAVGAALGSILPRTTREDRWMGETRDQLKHQAEELGREELEKAKSAARAAYDAAIEEADLQGLTPEGGRSAMDAAKHKVERVGEAAREAAKEEADRQGLGHPGHGATTDKSGTNNEHTGSTGAGDKTV
jgi:hypothetical protein